MVGTNRGVGVARRADVRERFTSCEWSEWERKERRRDDDSFVTERRIRQERFEKIIAARLANLQHHKDGLLKCEALYASLQQRAFQGEL